jgi:CubicO group peptidase (beta-lactamase class C family)
LGRRSRPGSIAALVGIAAGSGAIRSLDAPLLDYFPEYADLRVPERRQITIRHALTMSAGLDWNEELSIPALPPAPRSACPS